MGWAVPLLEVVVEIEEGSLAKRKRMTSHGGVALACVRCENGYWVLTLYQLRVEPMSNEQLDAVRDQLMSDDNADLRQSIYKAFLEDTERGANMIIAFATDKGLKLDAAPSEVVNYMDNLDDDDIDIEMTPEMLTSVSGGKVNLGLGPQEPKTWRGEQYGDKFYYAGTSKKYSDL